jgi:hypothetical protein
VSLLIENGSIRCKELIDMNKMTYEEAAMNSPIIPELGNPNYVPTVGEKVDVFIFDTWFMGGTVENYSSMDENGINELYYVVTHHLIDGMPGYSLEEWYAAEFIRPAAV